MKNEFVIVLTDNQVAGWNVTLSKINEQRSVEGLELQTLLELMHDQLSAHGESVYKQHTRAQKPMSQAQTDAEAIEILRAKGYAVQAPR